jgi:large subunit ribosomal protein L9
MDVILLQRIEKLGQMGDTVRVKDGYARNFLLPNKKALRATKENQERFEKERVQLEARNLEERKEAETVGGRVDGSSYVIIRQAGDSGQLYGSVSTRDIAGLVSDGGTSVTRNQIVLDRPIKTVGLHDVRISLHPEVIITVVVNVARSDDEAERQARGEVIGLEAEELEEEEVIAVEEVFEDETVAEQAVEELAEDAAAEEAEDEHAGESDGASDEDGGDAAEDTDLRAEEEK